MDDALQRKLGANEALFREANEAIERGLWPGDEDRVVRFRCECAELECGEAIELTVEEYRTVREHPRRFFIVDGHERPGAERVVERHSGYVVVEKLGEGGEVAEATDPHD
jgi:hypothetical protein